MASIDYLRGNREMQKRNENDKRLIGNRDEEGDPE